MSVEISDRAVALGATVLQPHFRRWGVQGDGEVTARDVLAVAVPVVLEDRVEAVARKFAKERWSAFEWHRLIEDQRLAATAWAREVLGLPSTPDGEVGENG